MNKKQLLIALATGFSGINLAATPASSYDFLPIDQQQFCVRYNTENCQKMAVLFIEAQKKC